MTKKLSDNDFTTKVVKVIILIIATLVPLVTTVWAANEKYRDITEINIRQDAEIGQLKSDFRKEIKQVNSGQRLIMDAIVEIGQRQQGSNPKIDLFDLKFKMNQTSGINQDESND